MPPSLRDNVFRDPLSTDADFKASAVSRMDLRRGRRGHITEGLRFSGQAHALFMQPGYSTLVDDFIDHRRTALAEPGEGVVDEAVFGAAQAVAGRQAGGVGGAVVGLVGQMFGVERAFFGAEHGDGEAQGVAELADVAGPRVTADEIEGGAGEAQRSGGGFFLEDASGEGADVAAFAQGGQGEVHGRQAEIQVGAEFAAFAQGLEGAVAGTHQRQVDLLFRAAAQRGDATGFQNP